MESTKEQTQTNRALQSTRGRGKKQASTGEQKEWQQETQELNESGGVRPQSMKCGR